MSEWGLPCGCIVALEPIGFRMAWAVIERCAEHPSGDVPVPSMALLDLRISRVFATVDDSRTALAPDLPTRSAGADEPEADPSQTVAADPSVVDSESDTVYGDAMREHERQSWLRRVQAQPIER